MKKILCFLMACMMLCSVALAEEETDPLAAEFLARTIDGDGAGTWITWSLEDLRQFQEVTGMEGTLLDEAPADWLTQDQVYELAVSYIVSLDEMLCPQVWYDVRDPEPLTEELARSLSWRAVAASETETGTDVWYLWIYDPEWLVPALDCYALMLDAHTGDILYLATPGGWG